MTGRRPSDASPSVVRGGMLLGDEMRASAERMAIAATILSLRFVVLVSYYLQ